MASNRKLPLAAGLVLVVTLIAIGCATSPLGRRQLVLFPDADMAVMGAQAFDQMKTQVPLSENASTNAYVDCVAQAVTAALDGPRSNRAWEVLVFDDESANAFALPGSKIGVHTGLLEVAVDQNQLATVIGHEVAHVLSRHSNERVSTGTAAQLGMVAVQEALSANVPSAAAQQTMALLGLGAQVGIILPFSRTQESEADLVGLDLMARAGFDPQASVQLWRNMARHAQAKQSEAGGAPPEFMSTHPSHGTRIANLEKRVPEARKLYEAARAQGRRPRCSP